MVQWVGGNADTFSSLVYGAPAQATFEFMDQTMNNFRTNMTEQASAFFANCENVYRRVDNSESMRLIRAALRGLETFMLPDRIQPLQRMAELQHAPLTMMPWVMANPMVRTMWQNNQVEGYNGKYVDLYGDVVGDHHREFRGAVNGLWREYNGEMRCDLYADIQCEPELQLTMREQVDINLTWIDLEAYLHDKKDDPTSRFNAKL